MLWLGEREDLATGYVNKSMRDFGEFLDSVILEEDIKPSFFDEQIVISWEILPAPAECSNNEKSIGSPVKNKGIHSAERALNSPLRLSESMNGIPHERA